MTCMGAGRSSKFSQIRPPTAELAALERLKNPLRLIMGKSLLPLFLAVLDRIHFILAGDDDIRPWTSLKFGQIRLLVPMATDRVILEKTVLPLFLGCFLSNPFRTCR